MIIDVNFQTPSIVAIHMVKMIPDYVGSFYEPTPGLHNISEEGCKLGFTVHDEYDFFLRDQSKMYECIVMNPPFSKKSAYTRNAPSDLDPKIPIGVYFLTECMKMSDNIIALMPWSTVTNSDKRLSMLKQFGLKSITALPRKTFPGSRVQVCILELKRGWDKETIFKSFTF
jgi:type I restriction-modification system DNA methylase subunit